MADVPITTAPSGSGTGESGRPGIRERMRDRPSPGTDSAQPAEIALWIAAIAGCLGLAALARAAAGQGWDPLPATFGGLPFTADRRPDVSPASLLAPAVAAVVVIAAWRGVHTRLRWIPLLVAGYVAALGWAVALAAGNAHLGALTAGNARSGPADVLAVGASTASDGHLPDLGAADADLAALLRTFTEHTGADGYGARARPPGPTLLVWALAQLGITAPTALGAVLTALGAVTVPLVAIAVRSLCHEAAARRLVPVLVLAPWALWTVASVDAVTAAVGAAFVTLGVVGSEPGRRLWWAVACGLFFGVATLFDYAMPWLGATVVATYFVRRRPLLNVITGGCFLVPLSLLSLWGFSWSDGLAAAREGAAHTAARAGLAGAATLPESLTRLPVGLAVVLVACGPLIIRAVRRIRLTPGWPFLVGAVPAVLFGVLTGLAATALEWSWLPFYCWLVVPALAPDPRPSDPGDTARAGTLPLALTIAGALTALIAQTLLSTAPPLP
ncbi:MULTISPECIES: hypothetical protein [Protofrankia]|uniref:hypothetical protein n=1 Tax=Protofrankia TaxID=2994361 RepID=UPI00069992E0|nr:MULTISPECIES: hypothetical protein [Protofrankia]ONH36766.1 hypothetical protein BL254_05870 [Protofrankia sp. BMG5.30]